MPRYIVERSFPEHLSLPPGDERLRLCRSIVARNAEVAVTWLSSYVSCDRQRTYCVYEAPSPEAIRATATQNELPVDRITEVSVLDPYYYT